MNKKCIQNWKAFILTFVNQYFWKSESISIHFNPFSFAECSSGRLRVSMRTTRKQKGACQGFTSAAVGFASLRPFLEREDRPPSSASSSHVCESLVTEKKKRKREGRFRRKHYKDPSFAPHLTFSWTRSDG